MKRAMKRGKALSFAVAAILSLAGIFPVAADETDPLKLLKRMTDYIAAQQHISAAVDTDVEVITTDLQKIQFASSSTLELSRPDKVRVERRGGFADIEMVYDGNVLTVHGKNLGLYAQVEAKGTVEQLFERLGSEFPVPAPGADLLASDASALLTDDIVEAKYIGHAVIGGKDCDHLAFRDEETDWQIWIERGSDPIPRKYVITSKTIAAAPQSTVLVREWKTGAAPTASAFTFKPAAEAKKVAVQDITNIDEVPAGIPKGAAP